MRNQTSNIDLATALTEAWLSNPHTRPNSDDVPAFLVSMHAAVSRLASAGMVQPAAEQSPEYTPAVGIRKSLADPNSIVSLIDGKAYKSLKRHLKGHGLTPAEYRERYGLKSDYPMVAQNYAAMRSEMAKKIGLGRKPGEKVKKAVVEAVEAVAEPVKATAKRVGKSIAEAKQAAKDHLG